MFLGWGIDAPNYSDYKNRDVKGKIVMVLSGEPTNKGINLITNSTETSEWSQNWRKKVEVAREKRGKNAIYCIERCAKHGRLCLETIHRAGLYS